MGVATFYAHPHDVSIALHWRFFVPQLSFLTGSAKTLALNIFHFFCCCFLLLFFCFPCLLFSLSLCLAWLAFSTLLFAYL